MGKHDINAFLGAGTSFSGRLAFCGVVRIDGEFEGEIVSAGSLVVGENARVSGPRRGGPSGLRRPGVGRGDGRRPR